MRSSDLVPLLGGGDGPEFGIRYGRVLTWNPQTGANTIDVAGTVLEDLPILAIGVVTLAPGDVVALMRSSNSALILGRVNGVDNQRGNFMVADVGGLSTSQVAKWATTTSGSFVDMEDGWLRRAGSELAFFCRTFAGPNTNAEFELQIDGITVATDSINAGAGGEFGTFTEQGFLWPGETDWENAHTYSFRARRTAGTGNVALAVRGFFVT